ncbi:MAG: hypothetical protein ACE5E3_05670, partial [Mariprofundus sp.]
MNEKWLSVPDAASQMGISDADLFKKALGGELTLSVRFITEGRGKICTGSLTMPEAKEMHGGQINERLATNGEAVRLNGIYDLPMLGAERERVEIEYLNRLDDKHAASVHIETHKSAYVKDTDGTIYELQTFMFFSHIKPGEVYDTEQPIGRFIPTGELANFQFVVRESELRRTEAIDDENH